MSRFALAAVCASLAFAGPATAAALRGSQEGIDVLSPPLIGGQGWTGDRMRGAGERLKDILPGSRS
jgi:hypothetical protein